MSSAQVQESLRKGPIIIENQELPTFSFDRELFSDMLGHGNMHYVVLMEGEAIDKLRRILFEKFHIQINLLREMGVLFPHQWSLCFKVMKSWMAGKVCWQIPFL
jgi:hypothetical protein